MLDVHSFVDARLYKDDQEVIQDALRYLIRGRPDLRVRLAIHRYQTEDISLAKAASLAGVSWAQMKDILVAHGVQPRLGPETLADVSKKSTHCANTLRPHDECHLQHHGALELRKPITTRPSGHRSATARSCAS